MHVKYSANHMPTTNVLNVKLIFFFLSSLKGKIVTQYVWLCKDTWSKEVLLSNDT